MSVSTRLQSLYISYESSYIGGETYYVAKWNNRTLLVTDDYQRVQHLQNLMGSVEQNFMALAQTLDEVTNRYEGMQEAMVELLASTRNLSREEVLAAIEVIRNAKVPT